MTGTKADFDWYAKWSKQDLQAHFAFRWQAGAQGRPMETSIALDERNHPPLARSVQARSSDPRPSVRELPADDLCVGESRRPFGSGHVALWIDFVGLPSLGRSLRNIGSGMGGLLAVAGTDFSECSTSDSVRDAESSMALWLDRNSASPSLR
jgi:hypothetical protein